MNSVQPRTPRAGIHTPDHDRTLSLIAQALRPQMTRATAKIVRQMEDTVPCYGGPVGTRRHRLFIAAARTAAELFLDGTAARPEQAHQVAETFRGLGYAQGRRGPSREPIDAALHAVTQCSWRYLADFAVGRDLSNATLRMLTDALFDFLEHLRDQLIEGFELARKASKLDPRAARARLFRLFTTTPPQLEPGIGRGVDENELRNLAEVAEWPIPEKVVALAICRHGGLPAMPRSRALLVQVQAHRVLVACPSGSQAEVVEQIVGSDSDLRIAVSWPVPPTESGSALRWCQRTLDLVQAGIIAPSQVIHCAEHTTQLWLHAEPSLRQHLSLKLLRPLLAEPANSRAILSETLLAWVETRESAPGLAIRLGIHPQTVRYRWKRINELLGDSLRDPEAVLQMTLVLKSSVALWKADDRNSPDLAKL